MLLERTFVEKPWGRSDLSSEFGAPAGDLIGEIWYNNSSQASSPILVKWLFTSEKLSIQVHPSDADAQLRSLPSGKEEFWYIVDAAPGAVLGLGTRQILSAAQLRAAAQTGQIEQLIDWKPVKAGDFFYIPAGTVHAIGAGITLVEVQQPSDITYRLYDYGRPRELHIDDAVAVANPIPYSDARSGTATADSVLVESRLFSIWLVTSEQGLATIPDDVHRWLIPLEGDGLGDCMLVPPNAPIEFRGKMLVAAA